MTATLRLKRRVGSAGLPSSLLEGELAFHDAGGGPGELYIGTTPSAVLPLVSNTRQVEIAGAQTITGIKTFSTTSLKITGGGSGNILSTDGLGNLSWIAASSGGAYQPLDADLTSLAGASATNSIYYRSVPDTWVPITIG